MLPKSKRLSGKDFNGLKTRIVYRGACFDVAMTPYPTKETRFACVISKKRVRRAVDRNRIKRKVYAALEHVMPPIPLYVIVYPTKSAASTPFSVLREEFSKAFATL